MKRHRLSGKEIRALNEELSLKYNLPDFLDRQANIELIEDSLIQVNGESQFFYFEGQLIPTLKLIHKNNFLKSVVIDMPAVKFIANGADIMRPGIKEVAPFARDEIITIVDQNNRMPLAIGLALYPSEEIAAMDKGKVIKNLHYVGDSIWKGEVLPSRPQ